MKPTKFHISLSCDCVKWGLDVSHQTKVHFNIQHIFKCIDRTGERTCKKKFYILIFHYPPPACGFWLRLWAWTGEYSLASSIAIHFVIPLCRFTFHHIQLHCYWSKNNSITETKARDPSGRQCWGLNKNRENVPFLPYYGRILCE